MNNACFPWLILVPERDLLVELTDLSASGRMLLMEESAAIMNIIKQIYAPDKMNIGALGNNVPQFHMHIIARFKTDQAWPGPVWGEDKPTIPYSPEEMHHTSSTLLTALKALPNFTAITA